MTTGFAFPPPPPPPPRQLHNSLRSGDVDSSESNRGQDSYRGHGSHNASSRILPNGAYINPNFQPVQQRQVNAANGTQKQSPSNEAVASSNTSQQSINAFSPYPDRSAAGHKRKLDVLQNIQPQPRPGPKSVPAVPSFGTPIASNNVSKPASTIRPPRSLFGLNASHGGPEDDESSNDDGEDGDVDEEAMYAQLGNSLVFEYEGVVVTLSSEADLARWQQERRRRFPTNNRIAQKEAERRLIGEERKRLLESAYALQRPSRARRPPTRQRPDNSDGKDVVQQPQADIIATSTRNGLLGLAQYDSDEQESDVEVETATIGANEKASTTIESDDEPPDETSSRPLVSVADVRPACKYYFNTGRCKQGDACSYRHEAQTARPLDVPHRNQKREKPRAPRPTQSQKKGIHQVLLDQENAVTDKLALQALKHLGRVGFFTAQV